MHMMRCQKLPPKTFAQRGLVTSQPCLAGQRTPEIASSHVTFPSPFQIIETETNGNKIFHAYLQEKWKVNSIICRFNVSYFYFIFYFLYMLFLGISRT
jgi:hypothetical protein